MTAKQQKVCIIGLGFGGVTCAKFLSLLGYEIVLIDKSPNFEFLPNIHEILSGLKSPEDLSLSREALASGMGTSFICDTVIGLNNSEVLLESGQRVSFDACIIATGGRSNAFKVPGARDNAVSLKSVADALEIRQRMLVATNSANPFRVSVIGGGAEGIEVLGELLRAYRSSEQIAFNFIVGSHGLHPAYAKHMTKQRVQVISNQRVAQVNSDSIVLESGERVDSDLSIWSGGLAPQSWVNNTELGLWHDWIKPNRFLQSSTNNIFAIGDCVHIEPIALEKTAPQAMQMAAVAGWNVHQYLNGRSFLMLPYFPFKRPIIVTFGDYDAYLVTHSMVLSSKLLSTAKELIYRGGMAALTAIRGGGLSDQSKKLAPLTHL